ncbi:hypothetical protein HNQ51_000078 [Inhella inkyongensis]|uniref:Polysaccharide biosynthesis protein n=1 Tax=Inhella inkyongensis TaxID=392593 RepID=A0A840RXX1_9BURK|nr:hypothetical protein [Inhella inkyongensis]MBB5202785.1 hypothetical protein [Inhella inkyongensis]
MKSVERTPIAPLLLQRFVGLAGGGITVGVLPFFLSSGELGYYFTYMNLLAAQIAFDCGLSYVILQKMGGFAIDAQRPDSIGLSARERISELRLLLWTWSRRAALLFCCAMLSATPWLKRGDVDGSELMLWLALVPCVAMAFLTNTRLAYFEGRGRMADVALLRAKQGLVGAVLFVLVLWTGGGLWAALAPPIVQSVSATLWIQREDVGRSAFVELSPRLWRDGVWPMQWRIALSWAAGYAATAIFVPATFAYHGPVEAGKLGISQAVFGAVALLSQAWPVSQNIHYCILFKEGCYQELWELLREGLFKVQIFCVSSIAILTVLWYWMGVQLPSVGLRFVEFVDVVYLGLATWIGSIIATLAVFLRARQQEPLLLPSLMTGLGALLIVIFLAERGVTAMLAANACLLMFAILPWVVYIAWRAWQRDFGKDA